MSLVTSVESALERSLSASSESREVRGLLVSGMTFSETMSGGGLLSLPTLGIVFDEADLRKPGKDMRKTETRIQVNIGVLGGIY